MPKWKAPKFQYARNDSTPTSTSSWRRTCPAGVNAFGSVPTAPRGEARRRKFWRSSQRNGVKTRPESGVTSIVNSDANQNITIGDQLGTQTVLIKASVIAA